MHVWFELWHNIVCGIEKYPGVEIRSWTSNWHQMARNRTWAMCYLLWIIFNQTGRIITISCCIACWLCPDVHCATMACQRHGRCVVVRQTRCTDHQTGCTGRGIDVVAPSVCIIRHGRMICWHGYWSLSFGSLWHGGQRYGYDRQVNLVISRSSGHLQLW